MNWIARSSQQVEPKPPFLPYRNRWADLKTRLDTLLSAHSGCIGPCFVLLLATWAAYSWGLTIERMVRYYNPLPIWDYWNIAQHLPQYRAFDIRVLWIQHNEHRIVFPEIVFAVDMLLVHGRQVLPLVISFVCYFSTWLLMSSTIFSDQVLSRTIRYSAILVTGSIIGWQGSVMALGIPFLLNWTLTQFAAVLALVLTAALKSNLRLIYLAGALVCGSIATYSSANGMLIWPVIIIAGLVAAIGKRYMFVIAVTGITNIGLYFVGYRISHELDIGNLVSHPIYLLGFLASYVSMPFGALKVGSFGVWVGVVNLLIFFYLLSVSVRTRLLSSLPAIVLFGYFVFTLLTAILTAAGRMNSSDMTFTAAKASRYLTVPLANWGALLIALVWLSGRCGWRLASPRGILLLSAVLLFMTFPKFVPWLYGNDLVFAQQQWAAISVENGLFDPKIARYLYPDPPFIAPFLQWLRNDHLSIFYKGYSLSLGQPFTSRFPLPSARGRLGVVTDTVPVLGGLEVVGWTDANRPERFVFVDQSSRIVGLGRRLPAGFPLNLSSNVPPLLAWVGFINLSFASKSFSTYSFGPHEASPTLIAGPSPVTPFALGPVHAVSQTAVQSKGW